MLLNQMNSTCLRKKVKYNGVQEASVQITETKVQYYSVRMTTYPRVLV